MLCEEFDARLQWLLDCREPVNEDAELCHHAAACPSCAEQWRILQDVLDSLDVLEVPTMSEDFSQRVVAAAIRPSASPRDTSRADQPEHTAAPPAPPPGREQRRPPSRYGIKLATVAALACSLLLLAVPAAQYFREAPGTDHARRTASVGQKAAARSRAPRAEGGNSSAGGQGDQRWMGDQGWMVSTSLLDFYPAETRARHRAQVNQLADDLRPITAPFNAALTAIRRTLPGGESNRNEGDSRASREQPLASRHVS
jgi:hypothetical protein